MYNRVHSIIASKIPIINPLLAGLLLVMGTIVYLGVKFVNRFASIALACVIMSIIVVYAGIAYNFNGSDKLQ